MSRRQYEEERKLLLLATDTLRELYGDFDVDESQKDRPDAAIVTKKDRLRIGIEITSVDRGEDLAYFNESKLSGPTTAKQIDDYFNYGKVSEQPLKRKSIPFNKDYISKGVESKREKYPEYVENGNFEELIVLAFSQFLSINYRYFENYHRQWANYLLSDSSFPFAKVIFVDHNSGKSILVYDSNNPLKKNPKIDLSKERGTIEAKSSFVPVGHSFKFNDLFEQGAIVEPKSKSKKVRKQQKQARR